jgi:4-amino-4-deoxy-L-arabinose transferase-like glycosyltransferase
MRTTLRLVYVLAILRFIFPYIIQDGFYQPHRDEFLYLFEGHHLAWGYMEIPPLLAVLAKTVHWLGDGFFWIKFWPSVFGSLTLILVGNMVVSLGGRIIAVVLSALPFFNGVYLRLFFLFQPNSLDVFFWTALAYCILRYIQSQNRKWLYGFGICVGLGMMSKYSTAFYSLALLLGLLFTKQRRIYLQKDFYIAMAMSFFIFLPNLIWQYNHRFPVIHHMQELQEEQLRFIGPIRFLVSQMLMNLASVFVWVAVLFLSLFPGRQALIGGWHGRI